MMDAEKLRGSHLVAAQDGLIEQLHAEGMRDRKEIARLNVVIESQAMTLTAKQDALIEARDKEIARLNVHIADLRERLSAKKWQD